MSKLFSLTVLIYFYCTICTSTPSPTSPPYSCNIAISNVRDPQHNNCKITCSIKRNTYIQHFGTTFNLCPLTLHGDNQGQIDHYEVHDSRFDENQNIYQYKYYFNIADVLYKYPDIVCQNVSEWTSRGYCVEGNICNNDTDLIPITKQVWAYQIIYNTINNTVKDCYRLSDENAGPGGPSYTLINEINPTKGIELTYHNGDWCGDENVNRNRHFHIQLLCENEMFFVPENELLYEDEKCHYIVSIPSIYGCPAECLVYDGQLCAGNGLCGYDYTNMISRCFCYHTFGGDACKDSDYDILNTTQKIHPNMESIYVRLFTLDTTNIDVIYDISGYEPKDNLFVVNDKDPENTKYNYYLSILDNILNPRLNPMENPVLSTCNSSGYAFQVDTITNSCYVLGTEYEWELYDKYNDPSKGVTIKYRNGTDCDTAEGTKQRTLSISFVCPDDIEEFYDPSDIITTYVEENEFCEYSMIIETAIACPFQCKTETENGFTVCSQHGICSADPYAGFVRCLCDDGYKGIDCNEQSNSSPIISTTMVNKTDSSVQYAKIMRLVLIIIVIFLILIVIGGAIVSFKCYKKWKMKTFVLQDRLSEYEQMDENDETEQQQQTNDNEESDSVR